MRTVGVFVIFLLFPALIHGQKKTVKEEFEACYFNALPDKGAKMKSLFKDFEAKLVKRKVLKDTTAESYLVLFKKVFKGDYIRPIKNYSFTDSIKKLTYSEEMGVATNKCAQQVMKRPDFQESDVYKSQQTQDSINKLPLSYDQRTERILATFSKKDFASYYTRLRLLLEVEFNMVSPFPEPLTDAPRQKVETNEVFEVYLNSENKVEILTKRYKNKDLTLSLKQYFQSKGEDAAVRLTASRATDYGKYVEVTKLIETVHAEVRNEYAQKVFQQEYQHLTEENKKKVDKMYPLKLVN
jgi:hypothetical protein